MAQIKFSKENGVEFDFSEPETAGLILVLVLVFLCFMSTLYLLK